ncbi:B3 domain-containing protein At2g31720-like [Salvia hispanica]|uniref:B3 domain-containing protein At2g31720-like n=1 Tax=Salvia hispanica TaxID=49212 RepID=UPI00200958C3|nr:B3 domain-containing protein At2g31720-like [Salvia hispanica]
MEKKQAVVELRLCVGIAPNPCPNPPPTPSPGIVIDAEPLRWAYPAAEQPRNKRRQGAEADDQRGKRRKIIKNKEGEKEEEGESALVPTVGLLRGIESRGGIGKPVLLFKKKLEKSDVGAHHNRLMVTRRERVMEFLTEEEAAAVESGGGLGFVGVDDIGNVYHELVLKKWASMDMVVVNSVGWKKVVSNNKGIKGDVLEIWGFRDRNHRPCFAFYFRVRLELTL